MIPHKSDGSGRIIENDSGWIIKDGEFIGQRNHFGEVVTNNGAYRNIYGDIIDSGGNSVGHVYGDGTYYTHENVQGSVGTSSSGGAELSTEAKAAIRIVFIAIVVLIALSTPIAGAIYGIVTRDVMTTVAAVVLIAGILFPIALPVTILFIILKKRS